MNPEPPPKVEEVAIPIEPPSTEEPLPKVEEVAIPIQQPKTIEPTIYKAKSKDSTDQLLSKYIQEMCSEVKGEIIRLAEGKYEVIKPFFEFNHLKRLMAKFLI